MNSTVTKIVVTGASGFLGKNFVESLKCNDRYLINALSSKGYELQLGNTSSNITFYDKDVIFTEKSKFILADSILINCAFPRNSTGAGMADGLEYMEKVFLKARECKVKAVINISSQSVYSASREKAATENTPVCLESTYAVGKFVAELMLDGILAGSGIAYTNIRLASLIGPGFNQRIVNRLVNQAMEKRTLKIKMNRQLFGFLDVKDAVVALRKVVETDCSAWKKVYNLGIVGSYSLFDIANAVQKIIHQETGLKVLIESENSDETSNSTLDARSFYKDFAYKPNVTLNESILQILGKDY